MSRKRVIIALKSALALALIVGVGWHFAKLLRSESLASRELAIRYELLIPAGLLYLAAHTVWATFFVQLLWSKGADVSWTHGVRAYFVSQFGKYIPGKAWVIVLRVLMLRRDGVSTAVVGLAATYETLTSMAAGAILGVCLLPWTGFGDLVDAQIGSWTWVGLVAIACLPLGFLGLNRFARRVVRWRQGPDAPPLPVPRFGLLARGLLQDSVGWCLLGLSLWLSVHAVLPESAALSPRVYLDSVAAVAISYVAGFVAFVSPSGLGARELLMQLMLARQLQHDAGAASAGLAAIIALVLRLVWTAFEVGFALMLFWLAKPPGPVQSAEPATVGGGHA